MGCYRATPTPEIPLSAFIGHRSCGTPRRSSRWRCSAQVGVVKLTECPRLGILSTAAVILSGVSRGAAGNRLLDSGYPSGARLCAFDWARVSTCT
jgi:hypothetical protein